MPRYRLHADCFVNGARQRAGAVIDFDGKPGSQMEPMDADAWQAFNAYQEERRKNRHAPLTRFPFAVAEAKATGGRPRAPLSNKVPEGWRDLKGFPLIHLAKRLGAPHTINKVNAIRFIEELEAKQLAALAPPAPATEDPNQALAAAAVADGQTAAGEQADAVTEESGNG